MPICNYHTSATYIGVLVIDISCISLQLLSWRNASFIYYFNFRYLHYYVFSTFKVSAKLLLNVHLIQNYRLEVS